MTRTGRRALAQRLTTPPPTKDLITGTVAAIDTAARALTVTPYAGAPAAENLTVPYLAHYTPVVGDTVCLAWVGGAALVCLGSYNPPTNLAVPGNATIGGTLAVTGLLTATGGVSLPQGTYVRRGPIARPTLLNGWVNYGGGYEPAGFIELPDGRGTLVGVVKDGTTTSGTTIFTIPTHLRPANINVFLAPTNNNGTVQITVTPGGGVNIQNPPAAFTWVSLTGITWPVAGF